MISDSTQLTNVAVILAGGVGSRVGLTIPKQLLKVAGKSILEHTIDVFQKSADIDEIIVMMTPGFLDEVRSITQNSKYPKVTQIIEGAETRNKTTERAIAALGARECNVLFHDAVRPLLSTQIISNVVEALTKYDAVDTAIKSADTIIQVQDQECNGQLDLDIVSDILPRNLLRRGQTPQAFRLSVIRRAYELAAEDSNFEATDDCAVILRYLPDIPIAVVEGSEENIKITEPIDLHILDKLFQLNSNKLPNNFSKSQFRKKLTDKTVVVLGGSYGIGADIVSIATSHGANVFSFSRSSTGTHIENRSDLQEVARQVFSKQKRIDFVVNTAGSLNRESLVDSSEETVYQMTDVNYLAPIFIAQSFYPYLKETQGSLLFFTSSSYTRGRASYSLYSSAKSAVVNLTQALSDEWSDSGVKVNCINPERTGTPMRTNAFGQEPPGSLLDSQAVAEASLRVLISGTTGHTYDVRKMDPLADH